MSITRWLTPVALTSALVMGACKKSDSSQLAQDSTAYARDLQMAITIGHAASAQRRAACFCGGSRCRSSARAGDSALSLASAPGAGSHRGNEQRPGSARDHGEWEYGGAWKGR